MKRTKIVMVSTIVLAIGSAFVTKASTMPSNAGFIQVATACTATSTICDLTSAHLCSITVYKNKSLNTCSVQLTRQP